MLVSPGDYHRMTRHKDGSKKRWTLKICRNKETGEITKIYARRCGRGDEPRRVMAHREILNCIHSKAVVDHVNGWGLDNRRANLFLTNHSGNGTNSNRSRTKNHGLATGVEPIMRGGEVRYRGMRAERYGRKDPKTGRRPVRYIRSKRTWKTPEPAARWYENQRERKYGIRPWVNNPKSVTYPVFPPKLKEAPPKRTSRAQKAQRKLQLEVADVPF